MAKLLQMHDCDNYAVAVDRRGLRLFVRACKEAGNVLRALGHTKRQPFKWNLFYWLPEWVTARIFAGLFGSRFAEIAFAQHARAAPDEIRCLARELETLADRTTVHTPCIRRLRRAA